MERLFYFLNDNLSKIKEFIEVLYIKSYIYEIRTSTQHGASHLQLFSAPNFLSYQI